MTGTAATGRFTMKIEQTNTPNIQSVNFYYNWDHLHESITARIILLLKCYTYCLIQYPNYILIIIFSEKDVLT